VGPRVGLDAVREKSYTAGNRPPGSLTRSPSLHRVSYPDSCMSMPWDCLLMDRPWPTAMKLHALNTCSSNLIFLRGNAYRHYTRSTGGAPC
jgi:hypothetical protein